MRKIRKRNPIRLRSKCLIIVYPEIKLNENELIRRLQKVFKIKDEKNWKYFVKNEMSSKKQKNYVTIYLKFEKPCDVYSERLDYPNENIQIKPNVWSFSEASYPLYSVLKFTEELYKNNQCKTNMKYEELQPFILM